MPSYSSPIIYFLSLHQTLVIPCMAMHGCITFIPHSCSSCAHMVPSPCMPVPCSPCPILTTCILNFLFILSPLHIHVLHTLFFSYPLTTSLHSYQIPHSTPHYTRFFHMTIYTNPCLRHPFNLLTPISCTTYSSFIYPLLSLNIHALVPMQALFRHQSPKPKKSVNHPW